MNQWRNWKRLHAVVDEAHPTELRKYTYCWIIYNGGSSSKWGIYEEDNSVAFVPCFAFVPSTTIEELIVEGLVE